MTKEELTTIMHRRNALDEVVENHQVQTYLPQVVEMLAPIRADLTVLLTEVDHLYERQGFTYCAYCDAEFPIDAPDLNVAIGAHIKTCEKHPIRMYAADNKRLREALVAANEVLCGAVVGYPSSDAGKQISDALEGK